jgi:hypothetical protein
MNNGDLNIVDPRTCSQTAVDYLIGALIMDATGCLIVPHYTQYGNYVERETKPHTYKYERWAPTRRRDQSDLVLSIRLGPPTRTYFSEEYETWYGQVGPDGERVEGVDELDAGMRAIAYRYCGAFAEVPYGLCK